MGRHRARDERLPGVRPRRVPRQGRSCCRATTRSGATSPSSSRCTSWTSASRSSISTSYAPDSNPAGEFYQPTLFETERPEVRRQPRRAPTARCSRSEPKDINGDGVINIDDLQWEYLEGDGDFRSDEVTALRDEADIVITNPPFSLFREFVAWLVEGGKKFSIIGNSNAITYKEVFPLIQENRLWMGATVPTRDMVLRRSEGRRCSDADRLRPSGSATDGRRRRLHASRELVLVHQHRPRSSSRTAAADDHGRQHQVQQAQGGPGSRLPALRQLRRHRGARSSTRSPATTTA